METKYLTKQELPQFLPHGWKTEVAKVLGIHPITVKRSIRKGFGETYQKIVKVAIAKYGVQKEEDQ